MTWREAGSPLMHPRIFAGFPGDMEKSMKATLTILALALASPTLVAAPAAAQYGAPAPRPPQQQQLQIPPAPVAKPDPAERKLKISKAATKPLAELQAAVNANDVANIPAKLAAAQAVAQSVDEKYMVAALQFKAALAAKDDAALRAGLAAMLASGGVEQSKAVPMHVQIGKFDYKAKQYDSAAASFERALAIEAANTDALVMLAETRHLQGQTPAAVALLQRALKAKLASGQKADEDWYRRAVGLAYGAKLPDAVDLSRQWVAAYPKPNVWRDALRVYRNSVTLDETMVLDSLRLARATGALSTNADFQNYAAIASQGSSPGEAREVIDEAIAAKLVDPTKPPFKDIVAVLKTKTAMSRASLPQLAAEAKAGPTARLALRTADAYYGYGDYAAAAELYRAALTKSGADASLINLHLGMALARAGDKAGATAALNAVTGPRAELAKFWLVYAATRP